MTTNKQLSVRAKELARLAPVEDLPLAWSSTKGYADGTPAQRAALSASCTIELRPGLRVPNSRTHLEAIAKRLANYPDAAKSGSPRASVGAAARKPAKPSKARDFAAAVETIEGAMENAMAANWGPLRASWGTRCAPLRAVSSGHGHFSAVKTLLMLQILRSVCGTPHASPSRALTRKP
jgi:hypothetical protein